MIGTRNKEDDSDQTEIFERLRQTLHALAYRILGSPSDAEDAVQDTFLRWQTVDSGSIDDPDAWLATVCSRRCLDMLRAAYRTRVIYVGNWLPEPLHPPADNDVERDIDASTALSAAFLLLLERLSPKERAAYLLHEVFEEPYAKIAAALGLAESTCRKLVSRARANIELGQLRHATSTERQNELLSAFRIAISGGNSGALAGMLADDIQRRADGEIKTVSAALRGTDDAAQFLIGKLHRYWAAFLCISVDLNGGWGFVLRQVGMIVATATLALHEDDRAADIIVVRNPHMLSILQIA